MPIDPPTLIFGACNVPLPIPERGDVPEIVGARPTPAPIPDPKFVYCCI